MLNDVISRYCLNCYFKIRKEVIAWIRRLYGDAASSWAGLSSEPSSLRRCPTMTPQMHFLIGRMHLPVVWPLPNPTTDNPSIKRHIIFGLCAFSSMGTHDAMRIMNCCLGVNAMYFQDVNRINEPILMGNFPNSRITPGARRDILIDDIQNKERLFYHSKYSQYLLLQIYLIFQINNEVIETEFF